MSTRRPTPTNIITGFLGVGKTTTIINLLKHKSADEKWAVLVNEFGEIGIDGAMMSDHGAVVKEVPGGCMCCAAGVPMSVALTALLRLKPDRLLIEPTGLGHPQEVIDKLTSEQYQRYIDLKATIALVDPRNLSNDKCLTNEIFIDQLKNADVIVGSKSDLCSSQDVDVFHQWIAKQSPPKLLSKLTAHGDVSLKLLDIVRTCTNTSPNAASGDPHHHNQELPIQLGSSEKFIRKQNEGAGYFSCGWLFDAKLKFDYNQLHSMFLGLTADRAKAVVNTDKGGFSFNACDGVVSVNQTSLEDFESRIEIIHTEALPWDEYESTFLKICSNS